MRSTEPLPKTWRWVTVVVAVFFAAALTGGSTTFVTGVVALVVALAIGFAARLLYSRTRD